MTEAAVDVIEVNDLQIDCIVGVLEREQRATQRIVVDLRLGVDLEPSGESGDLARSADYAVVADQVRLLAEHGRFRLIETFVVGVCRLLLLPPFPGEGRAALQRVEVRVRKPEILAPVCVPGVSMARDAAWCRADATVGEGWVEERVVEVPEGGAWRVRLGEGSAWRPGDRALLVLAGTLNVGGRAVRAGERVARGVGEVRAETEVVLAAVGRP